MRLMSGLVEGAAKLRGDDWMKPCCRSCTEDSMVVVERVSTARKGHRGESHPFTPHGAPRLKPRFGLDGSPRCRCRKGSKRRVEIRSVLYTSISHNSNFCESCWSLPARTRTELSQNRACIFLAWDQPATSTTSSVDCSVAAAPPYALGRSKHNWKSTNPL